MKSAVCSHHVFLARGLSVFLDGQGEGPRGAEKPNCLQTRGIDALKRLEEAPCLSSPTPVHLINPSKGFLNEDSKALLGPLFVRSDV